MLEERDEDKSWLRVYPVLTFTAPLSSIREGPPV